MPGGGLDARYEQLRHAALHARASAFPLGLGVLTGKGYGLRSREQRLRDAGMLTLTQMAGRLGVPAKTVKIWYHAGLITGHPFNDKGECLYPPPGPNPPTRAQGRKLSERRPTLPTAPAHDA